MRFFSLATLGLVLLSSQFTLAFPSGSVVAVDDSSYPEGLKGLDYINIAANPNKGRYLSDKVRGPCPFLNTAANHGFLPKDGRGIRPEWIHRLIVKVGVSNTFAKTLSDAAAKLAAKKGAETFDLDDLNKPRDSEHDVSLTRPDMLDETVPKINKPDPTLVEGMISLAKEMSGQKGYTTLTYASINAWRKKRFEQESKRAMPNNPSVMHVPQFGMKGIKGMVLGVGEGAFILNILGENGNCKEDVARSILLHETFPANWKPHPVSSWSLISGIGRGFAGFYTPDFILKWLHWAESPSDTPPAPKSNAEAESSSYGQRSLKLWSWAFGNTKDCPECDKDFASSH